MLLFICPLVWLNYAFAGFYIPNTPPVLIWGTDLGPSRSIFQPLRTVEFAKLLKPLWKDYMFLVYISPELTSKDFNCKECYPLTRQILPRTYYSQVEQPLKALERVGRISWPDKHNTSALTKELSKKIPCQLREIYAFNFKDRQLKQHDTFIHNISEHLADCRYKLLHIYTSHNELESVLSRRRWRRADFKLVSSGDQIHEVIYTKNPRSVNGTEKLTVLRHEMGILALGKMILAVEMHAGTTVYYKRSPIIIDGGGDPLSLALVDVEDVRRGITLILKNNMGYLTITVLPFAGNWLISRMSLNGVIIFFLREMTFFNKKFSYCCRSLVACTENGTQLFMDSFYLDIVIRTGVSGVDPNYKPKPCWSCEKYVTPSILQGAFTMIIFIIILTMGLIMIWDIGRNKRMQNASQPDIHIKTAAS